jgi:hypothetical protein
MIKFSDGKTFTDPVEARDYLRERMYLGVSKIDDQGDWEFRTVHFGLLRFNPPVVWDEELEKVSGWQYVGMAGFLGVYARKK